MAAGRADIEPQVRSEIGAAVAGDVDGTSGPTDDDFNLTPPDGTLVVDEGKLYARINGTWESFAPEA